MISTTLIGGIGNNLFQSATAFAFGLKYKVDVVLPTTIENPHYEGQQVHRFPGLKYSDNIIPLPTFSEQQFHYKPLPFMDFVNLYGYFQSHRYFNDYRKELLEALAIPYEKKEGWCSVHVRRQDYITKPDVHPAVTKEYLYEAMDYVFDQTGGGVTFEIYSDDTAWCSHVLAMPPFNKFHKKIYSGENEMEALQKMSCNQNIITANSSFSWWAAYLNQNPDKIVVSPRKWFGLEQSRNNTRDLYLPNSIIL